MGKKSRPKYRALAVSLTISAVMVGAGLLFIGDMTLATAWDKLLMPLLRLCLFIGFGLAVAQAIEARGWTRKIGALASPLFSYANLGHRCSAAFSTAFFSGVSANAMLVDYYQEEKISKQQVMLTNFINQFPAYFLHLPTTFFIVVPLTKTAGVLYFALTFAAVLLRTVAFVVYGRFFAKPKAAPESEAEAVGRTESRKNEGALAAIRRRLPARYTTILMYVVPIYVAIYFVNALGVFALVRHWLAETLTVGFIPVEALSVVVLSFVAEFTSGFAAAGALLDQGVITVKQTVLALIAGNVIAFPVRAIRHQLPRYMGIFQPKLGLQILLLGQFFRVASIILVAVGFYFIA
ncbi:MAG: nucleoside recognition protein [Desulfobacterales bacterium]|nr:nucleoside recognition protein [Desulfobacterales bacterium]